MPVAPRVRQPLQHQQTDALAPARAVGRRGERLAAAVRGQAALPAELDEGRRAST